MTLKDIAQMAGVSVATVSYVLNNRENKVSAEVADRVRTIVKEVGYQPDPIAKSLRSSKSGIIGVLTEDLSVWQVGRIVQNITHYAEEKGYSVVISDLGLRKKIEHQYGDIYHHRHEIDEALNKLNAIRARGVIFIGMHDRDLTGLIETKLPLVYAYCSTESQDDIQVLYDNEKISMQIMELLFSRFGDQVAVIGGPIQSTPASFRMAGVDAAYRQTGIPVNYALRVRGDWEYEGGRSACIQILDSGYPVKGIYALNDLMALGAIREIQDRGLSVPEDISVIGFDDITFGEYANPSLTTVHTPLEEIGAESAAMLLTLLDEGEIEQRQIRLDSKIVYRESFPEFPF